MEAAFPDVLQKGAYQTCEIPNEPTISTLLFHSCVSELACSTDIETCTARYFLRFRNGRQPRNIGFLSKGGVGGPALSRLILYADLEHGYLNTSKAESLFRLVPLCQLITIDYRERSPHGLEVQQQSVGRRGHPRAVRSSWDQHL